MTSPKATHLPVLSNAKTPEELLMSYVNGDVSLRPKVVRLLTPLVHKEFERHSQELELTLALTAKFLNRLDDYLNSYTNEKIRVACWVREAVQVSWSTNGNVFDSPDRSVVAQEDNTGPSYDAKQCPYGVGRVACDNVNEVLPAGKRIAPCTKCNMPAVAEHLAKQGTQLALEQLDRLGMPLFFIRTAPPLSSSPDFHCPVLNVDVVDECHLRGCSYHVNYPWAKNCALSYSSIHEGTLRATEIAILLNLPVKRVERSLSTGLNILRQASLQRAYDIGELDRDFEELEHENVCVVCERFVSTPVHKDGFTYCSNSCLCERLPVYVRIERKYGNKYRTVLQHALHRFETKEEAYRALGLKYDPNAFDPVESVQLKRRTGVRPAWLSALEKDVQRRLRQLDRTGT